MVAKECSGMFLRDVLDYICVLCDEKNTFYIKKEPGIVFEEMY